MVVLKVILGIMLIVCSFSVIAIPSLSAVVLCWMASIYMLIGGIIAIVRYIERKNAEKIAEENGTPYLKTGVGSLIFGIAAIVVSILSRSSAEAAVIFMKVISVMFGLWIVLDGVSVVIAADARKKIGAAGWVGQMVLGVLTAILGVVCIVNGFAGLVAMGTMFGISMMFAGILMLCAPVE